MNSVTYSTANGCVAAYLRLYWPVVVMYFLCEEADRVSPAQCAEPLLE